jgi:hypothetical protein
MTWTCQPHGLKAHFQRSQRIRAFNILLYALGLSFEAVATVMTSMGAAESDTSVYRDWLTQCLKSNAYAQAAAEKYEWLA